jgi:hypothetical protein
MATDVDLEVLEASDAIQLVPHLIYICDIGPL